MELTYLLTALVFSLFQLAQSADQVDTDELEKRRQEWAEQSHKVDSLSLLVFSFLLIATLFSIMFLKHKAWRYVHETGLSLIYGVIVGAVVRYAGDTADLADIEVVPGEKDVPPEVIHYKIENFSTWSYRIESEVSSLTGTLREKVTFDPEIFFNVFLPPIIFNAGFSMKKVHFFSNFGSILVYSFLGTTVSSFVVGGVTFGFSQLQSAIEFSFAECLFFGAIISATDPVTVLALFSDLGVDPNLYSMVFGESALNDAVAIVLSESVNDEVATQTSFSAWDAVNALGSFVTIFVGSWALGVFVGVATALLTKFARSLKEQPMIETSLFLILSHLSYLIAESVGFTGIVSLLFCGVTQAHYTYYNLSAESRHQTKHLFEFLSFLSENFIFLYMGITVFSFPRHHWNFVFIIGAFVAIILGRAANIYPLTFLINLARRSPHKIPHNFQHMLMFSGLRGAIAFALAIRNTSTSARQTMLTTTLLIVMATVIACGSLATKMLELLNIRVGVKDDDSSLDGESHRSAGSDNSSHFGNNNNGAPPTQYPMTEKNWGVEGEMGVPEVEMGGVAPRVVHSQRRENMHPISASWYEFDQKYIKPFLTVSQGHPLYLTFPQPWCQPIVRCFSKHRAEHEHNRDRFDALHEQRITQVDSNGSHLTATGSSNSYKAPSPPTKKTAFVNKGDTESDTDIILDNVGEIATSDSHPELHSVVQPSRSVSGSNSQNFDTVVKIAPPSTTTTSPKRGRSTPPPNNQSDAFDPTVSLEL